VLAVHGPQDLSHAGVAAILTAATGRPFRAERIPDDDMRARLDSAGLDPAHVDAVLGMSTGLREGFTPEDPRTILTTTPTTLAAWAHEHLVERGAAVGS
jgi:uncharacterized protein YbjT (DUF2867 family)